MPENVVVLGAGPAGLSVAAMLRRQGFDALVVDRAEAVGSSWRGHYDRLHLHTARSLSHLPGLRMPRTYGRWVSRDDVVDYLERYAAHHALRVAPGVDVQRVDRTEVGWRLETTDGPIETTYVVVATGHNNVPALPEWPGRDGFLGTLVHGSHYRNAVPYAGKDVLVVGAGNTGAEMAVDLVEGGARTVRLAVRTPPNIVRREIAGLIPVQAVSVLVRRLPPALVDRLIRSVQRVTVPALAAYGLPRPDVGVYTRIVRDGAIPILDVGLIDAVRKGQVDVVGEVIGFDGADVLLAAGQRVEPDAVVVATGYRRGLEALVGHLGVLRDDGRPVVTGGRNDPRAPGMWFTGFTVPISGMLRELGLDARRIARAARQDAAAANETLR